MEKKFYAFFTFLVLLNIELIIMLWFWLKILELCFEFRLVLIVLLAGHYGLKWIGHVMCFGQSDCSASKTRNPSDNKDLKALFLFLDSRFFTLSLYTIYYIVIAVSYCTQYNIKNMRYIDLLLANEIAHIFRASNKDNNKNFPLYIRGFYGT